MRSSETSRSACGTTGCDGPTPGSRRGALARALRLEYLTVGWNLIEGVVAIAAALAAGSVALLGFGIDSFVESASAGILIWRLRAEASGRASASAIETVERTARRWVGASLFALAAWVAFDAIAALWRGDRPDASAVGIALTVVSVVVMQWLARAKRRAATDLGSAALRADAFQTSACVYLSLAALAGMGLNALLGWWWADPTAALAIANLIAREGREAWEGRDCC